MNFIRLEKGLAFVAVCALAYAFGMTPGELVWGLLISSMVSGVVTLLLPLWVPLLFPELDRNLLPAHEPPISHRSAA